MEIRREAVFCCPAMSSALNVLCPAPQCKCPLHPLSILSSQNLCSLPALPTRVFSLQKGNLQGGPSAAVALSTAGSAPQTQPLPSISALSALQISPINLHSFFFIIRPSENACASNAFNEVILWKPDMLNKPGVILYRNNSVGATETARALLSKTWSLLKAVSVFYKTSASFPFLKPNPSLKACCVICWLPGCCNC